MDGPLAFRHAYDRPVQILLSMVVLVSGPSALDWLTTRSFMPTWAAFLGPLGIAIDYVLARGLTVEVLQTGPRIGSDHLPVLAELTITSP